MWYAESLPWRAVQPLERMLALQPTLLVGEAAFITLALVALAHARANGRHHLLLWLSALVGGCCNDVFFMILPFVDNFWHAQCFIMLTPRLPLYILGVYVAFIYYPIAASWRLARPPVVRFVASALTAGLLYAPFDCTGAKFLWWTWHDTDAAVQERWLGVPIGSTMFTIMFVFCVHALLHALAPPSAGGELSSTRLATSLVAICLLGTPVMMVAMTPCQMLQLKIGPDGQPTQLPGRPDGAALALQLSLLGAAGLLSAIAAATRAGKKKEAANSIPPAQLLLRLGKGQQQGKAAAAAAASTTTATNTRPPLDGLLWKAAVGYLLALVCVMALGEPGNVVAEGVHQEVGTCYVHDVDLSNYSRYKYLCAKDYDEDFRLEGCAQADGRPLALRSPLPVPSWFAICGKPHSRYAEHLAAVATLGVAASLALGLQLRGSGDAPTRAKRA